MGVGIGVAVMFVAVLLLQTSRGDADAYAKATTCQQAKDHLGGRAAIGISEGTEAPRDAEAAQDREQDSGEPRGPPAAALRIDAESACIAARLATRDPAGEFLDRAVNAFAVSLSVLALIVAGMQFDAARRVASAPAGAVGDLSFDVDHSAQIGGGSWTVRNVGPAQVTLTHYEVRSFPAGGVDATIAAALPPASPTVRVAIGREAALVGPALGVIDGPRRRPPPRRPRSRRVLVGALRHDRLPS